MQPYTLLLITWLAGWTTFSLLILPTLFYLFTGWSIRREKLLSYLGPEALAVYYSQFPYQSGRESDLRQRFRRQFNYLYGRRHFIMPMLVFSIFCAISVWAATRSVQVQFGLTVSRSAVPTKALFALLGGFVWVLSDQLASVARRDVGPKDIHDWSFRIILSLPFGLAVTHLAAKEIAYPIAFFMGTFPTQTLFVIGRRLIVSRLQLGDNEGDSKPELCLLQSVSRLNAEAYQDQGIETIAALAWADPVDLTIRTNYDFNYVLDCMSQALLWVYFEDKTRTLFRYSIRGSQEALALVDAYDGASSETAGNGRTAFQQNEVRATFQDISRELGMSIEGFVTTLRQVAVDPYTQFIAKVWR